MGQAEAHIAAHVANIRYEDLPPAVIAKIKTFVLDTLGVGIAGSSGANLDTLTTLARSWGDSPEATVWCEGGKISAQSAAMVNAYQIHCLEYDCVHEGAVLHPMATILSGVLAWAEREASRGRKIDGRAFIAALVAGIDISTMLGVVSDAPLRFFRPATAGGFGAVATIARMADMSETQVLDAMGAQYAQTSGTLQPHVEGSPLLGLQVGLNARAAIVSIDLATAGWRGTHDFFTGQYGYLALFEENRHHLEDFLPSLGQSYQIACMSHKPFPSGRLTHGAVDGLMQLQKTYGFTAADVTAVRAFVPELVHRLVGRADIAAPQANYAKLCLRFVAATYLIRGHVDVPDFRGEALLDPSVHALAAKIEVIKDDNPDPNAMAPQRIEVDLADGRRLEIDLPQSYGHPDAPLTEAENIAKFFRCLGFAAKPLSQAQGQRIVDLVANLETLEDISLLSRLTVQEAMP